MKNSIYRLSIFIILSILSAIIFFYEPIVKVFTVVVHREGSSHGIFVPFLSFYFLWFKFGKLKTLNIETEFKGLGFMIAGLIFPVLKIGSFHIQFMGFLLVLAGLVLLVLGKGIFRHTAFPLFFLVTMIPIPPNVYEALANYSRHIAFGGSLQIIDWLGIPYFRDGWLIQLHNALLEVAESCSGIRYLISYFVFGIAYAYITRENKWQRLMIVALTIPISHFASIGRLTVIFFMTHYFGTFWSQHKPHVFLSWSVFAAVLLVAIVLDQYFQKKKEARKNRGKKIEGIKQRARET